MAGRIGKDKLLHYVALLIITVILSVLIGIGLAILLAILVAITKEVWDFLGDGNIDWGDLAFDFGGIFTGVLLLWLGGII